MNPLREQQKTVLKKLDCKDLERKIQEIIDVLNKKEKFEIDFIPKYEPNIRKEYHECLNEMMADEIKKETIEEVEKLIVNEILICHHENTPTSRLTSLIMKLKKLK
jgi:hypothetical protein